MNSLSQVFTEMSNVFRGMISQSLTTAQNAAAIVSHIEASVCANCPNRANCKKTTEDTSAIRDALTKFASGGLERGGVNFLDAPPVLGMKCVRLNMIISAANGQIEKHRRRVQRNQTLDGNKLVLSRLLDGVGRLCKTFAGEINTSLTFDNDKSELIKDELLYHNVVASECLITRNDGDYCISLIIGKDDANETILEKVVSKICGHKVAVDSVEAATTAGFLIVTLKTSPRYAITIGVAQVAKALHIQNGDAFSILKINSANTLMAVCDGMGAGEQARRISTLSLTLVENFYKAAFPNEVIMASVNQLLTMTGADIFSALDIAVFNLSRGEVDFIKVGASDGFIKRAREIDIVTAGSLPMGVLDEMTPKITHAVLQDGDFIVILSDGVLEAFANDRIGLGNFINNLNPKTAQILADEIMQEALNRGGRHPKDDTTILVAQIIQHK
jgi:stage II sporulation protein E